MSDERILVGLDVGTTKVTTVIGEIAGDGVLDVIGEGTVASDGLRKGVVANLERTVQAIRASIDAAERVAGVEVTSVWLGVGGPHLTSFTSHGMAAIRRGQEVTRADLERTIDNARAVPMEQDVELLHVIPQEYVVDGNDGIKDPVGMSGVRLEVDVHVVAGGRGPLANLRRAVEDAGVAVDGLVVQALASSLAVLGDADEDVTTLVIDVGGGTTDVAVVRRGVLAHAAVLPVGGDHVTQDIAQLLRIPPDEAERVKRLHGVAQPELADRDVVLEVANPGYTASLSTFELAQVIKPRMMEILDLAKREVETHLGALELNAGHVVLTGGGSRLAGAEPLATERLRLPVRIAGPQGVSGLTDVVSAPTHATAVGLVRHATRHAAPPASTRVAGDAPAAWKRLRTLLKDFF